MRRALFHFFDGFFAMTTKPDPLMSLMNLGSLPPLVAPREDERYYAALGRFIVGYAGAEIAVHQLARKLSGLRDDRARVLFAGMRLGDAITRTRALLRLSKRTKKNRDDIDDCLKQLDVIGTQRDKMVHRDTSYESGKLIVTNMLIAKDPLQYERDLFTLEDLKNLYIDCLTISLRLMHIMHPSIRDKSAKAFRKSLHEPWHYKPPPPQTQKRRLAIQKVAEALLSQP
jgi:hypothetical protein